MGHPTKKEYQNLRFHPYNILLTLVLTSLTALFIAFSSAYVYTRVQNPDIPAVKLPNIFFFNTLILIASSMSMLWAKQCYLKDNTLKYQQALLLTVVLTLIFLVLQCIGWRDLFQENTAIIHSNMASYVYLISGLHFMHVIAGLPILIVFLWAAYKRMKEPVSVLVYFSDPVKRLKLRLLTIYWHFIDLLWIYLVLFFWINYQF